MDLAAGEEIVFRGHPSWRSIIGFYVKGTLIALIVGAALYFWSATRGILGFLLVLAIVLLVGLLKRIATTYVITTRKLHIRRGILARKVQETRLERVQNVNTNQSILERILQVGTVDFDTAGSGDFDFAFRGVSEPEDVVRAVERAQQEASHDAGV